MNEQARQYQQIIAKCWADDAFKQRLMADPAATLKQEGVDIPAGVSVSVQENTETQICLVIPRRPVDLSDDDLGQQGGGGEDCTSGCYSSC